MAMVIGLGVLWVCGFVTFLSFIAHLYIISNEASRRIERLEVMVEKLEMYQGDFNHRFLEFIKENKKKE